MDYPYPPIRENVNGKNVSILGVVHTPDFFKEHEPFFEEFISQQDALLLEECRRDFQEDDFFGKIGNIAKSQKKIIYQVDPRNNLTFITDLLSFVAGLGLMEYAAGSVKTKMSRRDFLRSLRKTGLAGIGASLFLGSLPGIFIRNIIYEDQGIYGIDDVLSYGSTDYSNIRIAEGILKISHEIKDIDRMAAIHGAYHSDGIYTYQNHPVLRYLKKLTYLPYEIIAKRKVREYIPNGDGWVLSRKI